MSTPSLLIVPARIKAGSTFLGLPGTLYSQIPTNGDGDFSLQRDGLFQTRYNGQGLIERVGTSNLSNVIPRLDYYTSSGTPGCPALLVEPAATNLALQSEGFSVIGTWSTMNSTQVTANTTGTTDPAGSTLSDLIFCQSSGTVAQGVNQSISIATSGTYTMSVFVKKASNFDWFRIQFQDPAAGVHQVYYNLVSGTLGAVDAGSTGTITNFGNGWYRLTHSRSVAAGSIGFGLRLANANSALTVPCDGISGAYIWGAQLETGSVATSYIPTTTAQRTRNADVISVSGAVSGSIGQTEGTLYAEVDYRNTALTNARIPLYIMNAGSPTVNSLRIEISGAGAWFASLRASNATIWTLSTAASQPAGIYKIAVSYKNTDSVIYINGNQVATSNAAFTFSAGLNKVAFEGTTAGNNTFNDRIRAAALYTTRLSNADLMLLTMPGNSTYLPQAVWDNYLSRPGNDEVPDCLYTRHADLLDV